jgi:hypothetical protein
MKNNNFAIPAVPAFCLALLLTGCKLQQPLHLNARKAGDAVELCLSNESVCPQQNGIGMDDISVYRYDSIGKNEIVWEAAAPESIASERIDGVIVYGIPPKNWHNKIGPPALVCGRAYLVNPGANFFALKCDGTVVVFDFQHLEEFFSQTAPTAQSRKPAGG